MKRKIGYIAADVEGRAAPEIASLLQTNGYDAVDWTREQFNPLIDPSSKLVELVGIANDHGLSVSQFMVHHDYVVTSTERWEQNVRSTELAIVACAEANIGTVGVLTGPNRWEAGHAEIGRDIGEGDAWTLALTALERVLRRAESVGSVAVSLEPCWGTLAPDRAGGQYLLDTLESDYLGINMDPSHYVMSGDDLGSMVRAWGNLIKHVHLKDAFGVTGDPDQDFIFLLPGEGKVSWPDFLGALDDIGYTGTMSVEFEAFTLLNGPLRGDLSAAMKLARDLVSGLVED
jgi:sugar phosphate isomerase/epimerase